MWKRDEEKKKGKTKGKNGGGRKNEMSGVKMFPRRQIEHKIN